MITKEDLSTLAKRRAELDTCMTKLTTAKERQALLDEQKEKFFLSGGKVVEIEMGKSGVIDPLNMPLRQVKEMEIARQRAITSYVSRNPVNKKAEMTKNTFIGAVCPVDGNTIRFLSNGQCKTCAQKRYLKNSRNMQQNTRRRDSVSEKA